MGRMLVGAIMLAAATTAASVRVGSEPSELVAMIPELEAIVRGNPADWSTRARLVQALRDAGRFDEAATLARHPSLADRPAPPPVPKETPFGLGSTGRDVWVCDLFETQYWGEGNGTRAYSIGTRSANGGDTIIDWIPEPDQNHPVIPQNIYRYYDGRLEQVGMSWLKHGFCAVQEFGCGECEPVGQPGSCPKALGPGCSDPYTANLNGVQLRLGPRSNVNPATGMKLATRHPFPNTFQTLAGRLQVAESDIAEGGSFLVSAQYVHPQDIADGNANNNCSWRPVSLSMDDNAMTFTGPTRQRQQPIFAWAEFDPDVQFVHVDIPNDGRVTIAYVTKDLGGGLWRYEFAIHNMHSDRAIGGFALPAADELNVIETGFHDVHHHSGDGNEPEIDYDGADWDVAHEGGAIAWRTMPYDVDPNSNALRWGTMYNFWMIARGAPTMGAASLELYKPGEQAAMSVALPAPTPPACPADFTADAVVGPEDLAYLLSMWGDSPAFDLMGKDGLVSPADLSYLLGEWGPCDDVAE